MTPRSRSPRSARTVTLALFLAGLAALLVIAWLAYHPGLTGAFLFDDLGSLPKLGATGPVDSWATFWRYITSGTADPTGRPLALLSFLIDARNWPADPYPFKVTNVVLHLLNGALLACVLWRLGKALADSPLPPGEGARRAGEGSASRASNTPRGCVPSSPTPFPGEEGSKGQRVALDNRGIVIAALFGAGAWLLHPLFVSTTLYVVQREAMLPATFVLIALLGWVSSREAMAREHTKRALTGMALSAWLCTLLAVLSKANGLLLPLLLLLVDWIVLSRRPMPSPESRRRHRWAVAVFLMVPSAFVVACLVYLMPHSFTTPVEVRGWSVGQRLLTEPRVLVDYLRLLFIPRAHSSGLFNDAFPASTDWLHPASTIPCMLFIAALLIAGFAMRKKFPAIALALLFYFTAQLMESSWVPLELYFEHRNYLPAMLLFWPIGIALGRTGSLRFLRVGAAALVLAALAVMTVQRATLWGDAPHQARVWAAFNTASARAQTSAALYDLQTGLPRLAAARLALALPTHPDDLQIPLNLITAECRLGKVRADTLAAARQALAHDRVGGEVAFNWFGEALQAIARRACSGIGYTDMQNLLDAARDNAHWQGQPGMQQNWDHMQGQLELAEGEPNAALQAFNRALAASPKPAVALQQAAYLGARGFPKLGLLHLQYFAGLPPAPAPGIGMQRIHAWVFRQQHYWQHDLAQLRTELERAAGGQSDAAP